MRRRTATLLVGMTLGLAGVIVYARLRSRAGRKADRLIDRLNSRLRGMERTGSVEGNGAQMA